MSLPWYELRYELVVSPHPPYSPDMPVSRSHFFSKLKIFIGGRRFSLNEELIVGVEYFAGLGNLIFKMGSRHSNIAGPSALVNRETTLKNKNSFNEVSFFNPYLTLRNFQNTLVK